MQDLILLFQSQSHRVISLWAFDFAEESISLLDGKYPEECRPKEALDAAKDWAAGRIDMRMAQRKILDCHAFSKEIDCREDVARCHAIGYPIYDLSAIIYKLGLNNCKEAVEQRKQEYIDKLFYWNRHLEECGVEWADFMLK